MTRLVSGRIQKIPSANVSAERYQFIEISEVEPDLGLPSALGQVFTSDLNGTRYWINLDTANINETSNLYFTNTRAILALDGADISVGNLISQDRIEGNTLSVSNIFADLITANTIISNTWVNLYSSNVIEFQNLFYTNSRVLSHLAESDVSVQDLTVVGNLIVQGNTTTLNTETLVVEDKNIVIANGAPNPAAADGAGITIEGANATITFVAATDSIEINKNTSILGNIAIGTGLGGSITGANLIVANILVATERIDGTATAALIANVANTVLSLSNFTTTDLAEGNNLYYTNVRVDAYINDFIDTDDISEANNLYYTNARVVSAVTPLLTTANVIETDNLYYTNARVDAYINDFIDTDDISEANNLYYTNARVLSHLSQSDVETRNLTIYGNLNVVGNLTTISASTLEIADPLIKIAANNETSDAVDFGWLGHYSPDSGATRQHAGVFRKHGSNSFYIFSQYVDEELDSGNLVTNINPEDPTFKLADVYGNVFYGRISTLENHTTDALVEGTNLYYTNTRVVSAVTPLLTTANVFELSSNLYYTNTRVVSAVTPLLTTANVFELSSNLYYTNARVLAFVETLSISDLRDVSNIYEANVGGLRGVQTGQALVWDGNINQFVPVFVNSEIANVADLAVRVLSLEQFTTANIAEASSNLYFTNTRVLDALIDSNVIVNNLFVQGDLTVQGNTVTLNVSELVIEDKNIVLANGSPNATVADNSGITIAGANATILYKESGNKFQFNKNLDVLGNIVVSVSSSITGANTISASTFESNLIRTDSLFSNTITSGTIVITSSASFSNTFEANSIRIDSVVSNVIISDTITITDSASIANVTVNGDLVGNLTGTADFVETLSNFTTDNLSEGSNLYYTNARVFANVSEMSINVLADVDITGILNGQVLAYDGAKFVPSPADIAIFSETANIANTALTVVSLSDFTTDDIVEGSNLYYTNSRVRSAFTAGRGIIIQENGTIKAKEETELFNLLIDGSAGYYLTDSMESAVSFANVNSKHRYLLRSLHVTNISEDDAYISSNIVYASGNVVTLANRLPIPVGGTLEFIKRTQVLNPADSIMLQSFDSTGVAANNLVSSIITYETADQVEDEAFFGVAAELTSQNSNVLLLDSFKSYSILESIKLVNLEDFVVRAKVFWTNANNSPKAYFSYNIPLPPNSSVELLQGPKRIEFTDRIFASINSNSRVSAFVSGKYGSIFEIEEFTSSTVPGNIILASFSTTEDDGETLYYTIE